MTTTTTTTPGLTTQPPAGCSNDNASISGTTTPSTPTGPVTKVLSSIIYHSGIITHAFTADTSNPQITASVDLGTFCVAIFDIGNATSTGVSYSVSVVHP